MRRQQILDAAARLATTDGLEATSIAKVAEAAGVAKGSIYLHFESRDDLIGALQAQVWTEMMEAPRVIVWTTRICRGPSGSTPSWSTGCATSSSTTTCTTPSSTQSLPIARSPGSEARALLGQLIAGGVAAGEFDCGEIGTETVVDFLLHGYAGPCYHHAEIDTVIGDMQQLFRRSVGAQPAWGRRVIP